jgi:hypothetical protein
MAISTDHLHRKRSGQLNSRRATREGSSASDENIPDEGSSPFCERRRISSDLDTHFPAAVDHNESCPVLGQTRIYKTNQPAHGKA